MRYKHHRYEESKIDDVKKPKNKIIPSTRRGAKLREELLSKIIPWEKITVSLDDFPYFVESVAFFFPPDLILISRVHTCCLFFGLKGIPFSVSAKGLNLFSRNVRRRI